MISSAMPSAKYSWSGIAAHVGEGKHRDGRLVGKRQRGRRRQGFWRVLLAGPDEADALALQRLDQPLLLAGVADRLARRVEAARHRGIGDDAALPDRADQFVLRDDAVAVLDQVGQEIEHLRLDRHRGTPPPQLAPAGVELAVIEPKTQWRASRGRCAGGKHNSPRIPRKSRGSEPPMQAF
jgi:hypothetical protein